jgi:hypothetical protein
MKVSPRLELPGGHEMTKPDPSHFGQVILGVHWQSSISSPTMVPRHSMSQVQVPGTVFSPLQTGHVLFSLLPSCLTHCCAAMYFLLSLVGYELLYSHGDHRDHREKLLYMY